MAKIYLASSWRNEDQPALVKFLRDYCEYEVYDFRNPPNRAGFSWKMIEDTGKIDTPENYAKAIKHPDAIAGFNADLAGMEWCDILVCLLPCGRSAHLELGWGIGQGKRTYVVLSEKGFEPELMYLGASDIFASINDFKIAAFDKLI